MDLTMTHGKHRLSAPVQSVNFKNALQTTRSLRNRSHFIGQRHRNDQIITWKFQIISRARCPWSSTGVSTRRVRPTCQLTVPRSSVQRSHHSIIHLLKDSAPFVGGADIVTACRVELLSAQLILMTYIAYQTVAYRLPSAKIHNYNAIKSATTLRFGEKC